jgi:hypothetical protein
MACVFRCPEVSAGFSDAHVSLYNQLPTFQDNIVASSSLAFVDISTLQNDTAQVGSIFAYGAH